MRPDAVARAMRHTAYGASVRDRLPANRVPTLIVAGTREAAFEEPCAHAERVMPLAEVVRLDGVGHSPNAEAPERFDALVTAFLARLR